MMDKQARADKIVAFLRENMPNCKSVTLNHIGYKAPYRLFLSIDAVSLFVNTTSVYVGMTDASALNVVLAELDKARLFEEYTRDREDAMLVFRRQEADAAEEQMKKIQRLDEVIQAQQASVS